MRLAIARSGEDEVPELPQFNDALESIASFVELPSAHEERECYVIMLRDEKDKLLKRFDKRCVIFFGGTIKE